MNGIGVTTQAYHMSIIVTIDFVSWIFLSSDRVDRMYNKSTLESSLIEHFSGLLHANVDTSFRIGSNMESHDRIAVAKGNRE